MKIVFICPFFGKLPSYFKLWLESCKYNKEIDWIVITDDKYEFKTPLNVKIINMSFNDIQELIKSKFNFDIKITTPYKLCDYKPAYGYIFEEIIQKYDFWGHCDLDCIFGDINYFIDKSILNNYDKILTLGHMTIYRNNSQVNRRFMLDTGKKLNYKVVYSSERNYAFDEWNLDGSINDIYEYNQIPYFTEEIYADISCLSYRFKLNRYDFKKGKFYSENERHIFMWKDGKLYKIFVKNNKLHKEEYAYVHFQKRNMKLDITNIENLDKFIIIPNKFLHINKKIEIQDVKRYSRNKIFYAKYFKLRYKNLKVKLYRIIKGAL